MREAALATPVYEDAYVFPLSHAQERLWFLEQLTPGLAAYNTAVAVRLRGNLDRRRLAGALAAVARRHEVLRTSFRTEEGLPVQVIAPIRSLPQPLDPLPTPPGGKGTPPPASEEPAGGLVLPLVDLRGLRAVPAHSFPPPAEPQALDAAPAPPEPGARRAEREAEHLAAAEAARPFDLRRGDLLRPRLLQLDDREHVLILTSHHIVSDAWSMGILVGELGALYAGEALPALPLQYADFAVWQREWLQGEVLAGQLEYWRSRLAGLSPLRLPADLRRPALDRHRGGRVRCELDAGLAEALRRLSRSEGVTLFMTLLAGFQALLARYSGQEDIAVGTAVANRTRREVEGLIGCFVNTLVLRTSLEGEPSFRELLARVRKVTLGAFNHQDLPFEQLVDLLRPAARPAQLAQNAARAPLVQVTFLLQNAPLPGLSLPGLELSGVPIEGATAKYDLSVALAESLAGGGIGGAFEYNTDVFAAATVERMVETYRRLLGAAVASPGTPVCDLMLMREEEAASLLADFNRGLA